MRTELRNHVTFRKRPFQTVHRCATCNTRTPTLRDRLDHARLARLPHRPLKDTP